MTHPTDSTQHDPAPTEIECLACGTRRLVVSFALGDTGDCTACGYSGWALPDRLSEHERNVLQARFETRRPGH
jgi:ribosomal protein L37E